MHSQAIEVINLHKQFGGVPANNGINLVLNTGEIHALIGPNGSGKTTLISQIMGQLTPTSGKIRIFGTNITNQTIHNRSKFRVSRSWQIPSLFANLSAAENVAYGIRVTLGLNTKIWKKASPRNVVEKTENLLSRVGLSKQSDILASDLSHGNQRKLDLAITLSNSPLLILLDEPLAGLEADEVKDMLTLINDLQTDVTQGQKPTILLVEHDMEAVFSLSDRVSVLVEGKIIATGEPDQIRRNPLVQKAYLGET